MASKKRTSSPHYPVGKRIAHHQNGRYKTISKGGEFPRPREESVAMIAYLKVRSFRVLEKKEKNSGKGERRGGVWGGGHLS